MAHGSARASHNTGPLGTASQYRITSCGKMRTRQASGLPRPTATYDSILPPGIDSEHLPCRGSGWGTKAMRVPISTEDGMGAGGYPPDSPMTSIQ